MRMTPKWWSHQLQVVAFIAPPLPEVIEAILKRHLSGAMVGGLWKSLSIWAPSEVNKVVLEQDAAFAQYRIG